MTHGKDVRARILEAGITLWPNVSARAIGRAIGMTHSAVLYHFDNAEAVRAAVARHAIDTGNAAIIAQLITSNDPAAAELTPDQRRAYLAAAAG